MPADASNQTQSNSTKTKNKAVIYRMVLPDHVCPFGVKALELLKREGFEIEEHVLTTRDEVDAFEDEHDVDTTPQVFVGGERIGGYDELKRYVARA